MKILLPVIFLITLCFPAFATDPFYPEQDDVIIQEKFWAEMTHKDGTNQNVSSFRIVFEYPTNKVFDLLINTNNLYKIHKNYADSRCLSQADFEKIINEKPKGYEDLVKLIEDKRHQTVINRKPGKIWTDYWYTRLNLPWPLNDKWAVQKVQVDETKAKDGIYKVDFEMQHGNLKSLKGWWAVVPVPDKPGWAEFRSQSVSDSGIAVPQFVARKTFLSSLKKEIEANNAVLAKSNGQN